MRPMLGPEAFEYSPQQYQYRYDLQPAHPHVEHDDELGGEAHAGADDAGCKPDVAHGGADLEDDLAEACLPEHDIGQQHDAGQHGDHPQERYERRISELPGHFLSRQLTVAHPHDDHGLFCQQRLGQPEPCLRHEEEGAGDLDPARCGPGAAAEDHRDRSVDCKPVHVTAEENWNTESATDAPTGNSIFCIARTAHPAITSPMKARTWTSSSSARKSGFRARYMAANGSDPATMMGMSASSTGRLP